MLISFLHEAASLKFIYWQMVGRLFKFYLIILLPTKLEKSQSLFVRYSFEWSMNNENPF